MRPETAHRTVRRSIEVFLKTNNPERLYSPKCVAALSKLDIDMRNDWGKDWGEYDERDPYELTGYGDRVPNEMMYISDRFRAPHRLNWLICGVKNKEFSNVPSYF